jgi:primosomal protein N' (replication factor Y)
VGARVVVQFGSRKIYTALVIAVHETPPQNRIPKYILSVLDEHPLVSDKQFAFWNWMAGYYLCHTGEVMNAALPSAFKLASETKVVLASGSTIDPDTLTEKEQLLVEALGHRKTIEISEVVKILGQQKVIPVIRTLIEKGIVQLDEELREKYRPKTEKVVILAQELAGDEEKLKDIFTSLEKRAVKQLEVLMTYLHMTRFGQGAVGNLPKKELLRNISGGEAALAALVKKKILELSDEVVSRITATEPKDDRSDIRLTPSQERALHEIHQAFEEKDVVLLHGITSSGKTELYIRLIQETLERGRQALYLLPEIALTTQIITRLRRKFGDKVGVYHSRFSDQEKVEIWNRTIAHQFDVILGARSAVFAPFPDLGLVIVDEEHDYSFKQVDPAPRYNGRDAALYLAHLHKAKAIVGSATPAIETCYQARQGKYGLVELFERYGNLKLPEIQVVDIKQSLRQGKMKTHFSSLLLEQVETALANREQVILFQNRRGFSLRLECETCHWMPACKNCDVILVYHKKINQLRCHYCGYVSRIPEKCPECNGTKVRMKGFGTERVEEDLQILFPSARIARMDLDTTRTKHAHQQIITDFEERKIDILVGTQMITKGLDFDHVSTVSILNADNMLSYPDFRSAERSFQLMAQVSGRSGRKKKQGQVIIQTWQPGHPVILDVVKHDYASMYMKQLMERKKYKYPPFYRLIILRLKHKKPDVLDKAASLLAAALREQFGNRILGPEYPVVSRIMNLYIKQILIKFERGNSLAGQKHQVIGIIDKFSGNKEFSGVRVIVDVDPV